MEDTDMQKKRQMLYSLLGRLPGRTNPVHCSFLAQRDCGSYLLEELLLRVETAEGEPDCQPIPAWFARPKGEGPFPAILYNHSHGGKYEAGRKELLEPAPYMQYPGYAQALTSKGYAVLCIDQWCFGDRSGRAESAVFKEMLWKGEYLWGRMVYDNLRALDYLCSRPDVDTSRIGTLGMSMGSTMAWWCAALDERIRVCVDLCCLTDYDALIRDEGLDRHGIYYYIPGLMLHFTASEINSLIAPRPHLGTVGLYDPLTPQDGVDRIEREVTESYALLDAAEKFRVLRYPVEHQESSRMRQDILHFLEKHL